MPSIQERVVATGRGVRAERDLAEAAADFYVLELLTAREDTGAARMLTKFEGCLAREFACYLDMAIGGELRYAMQHQGKEAFWRARRPTRPANARPRIARQTDWMGHDDRFLSLKQTRPTGSVGSRPRTH